MSQGLDEIRQRKKELMLESEINREILRVEVAQLRIKTVEWKRGLLKAKKVYNVVAPLAGAGLAFAMMRKRMHPKAKLNGGERRPAYMSLLAPLGLAALRKGLEFWKHARARNGTA